MRSILFRPVAFRSATNTVLNLERYWLHIWQAKSTDPFSGKPMSITITYMLKIVALNLGAIGALYCHLWFWLLHFVVVFNDIY